MKDLSGKFVLRIPSKLHARLKEAALRENVSLNQICGQLLSTPFPQARAGLAENGPFEIVVQKIHRIWGAKALGVLVFGSTARGDDTASSDVDLLIVLDRGVKLRRDLYRSWDHQIAPGLSKVFEREVSPQFVHLPASIESAGSLWLETAMEGIVLWENDFVVSRALAELRKAIAKGEATREESHGQHYWVRRKKRAEA